MEELSKRERIALEILVAYLKTFSASEPNKYRVTEKAVEIADELLKALSK